MSCEICGRGSCTRSFHSLEAQDEYDARQNMPSDVEELKDMVQESQRIIETLLEEIKSLKAQLTEQTS